MKKQISKKLLAKIDSVHSKTRAIFPNPEQFFKSVQEKISNSLSNTQKTTTSKLKI